MQKLYEIEKKNYKTNILILKKDILNQRDVNMPF